MKNPFDMVAIYTALGGAPALSSDQVVKHFVEPLFGKDFTAHVMFDDSTYDAVAERNKHAAGDWDLVYSGTAGQCKVKVSKDGEVIYASILRKAGIVGAYYVKNTLPA